jgi:outer membrane protein TolC
VDNARRSIEQAEENLRLNRNFYQAGTVKMSDLLEAQLLYQQACDQHVDAYANYQQQLLLYQQATGQKTPASHRKMGGQQSWQGLHPLGRSLQEQ